MSRQSSYGKKRANPGAMMYGPGCCAHTRWEGTQRPAWLNDHIAKVRETRDAAGDPNLAVPYVRYNAE